MEPVYKDPSRGRQGSHKNATAPVIRAAVSVSQFPPQVSQDDNPLKGLVVRDTSTQLFIVVGFCPY